MGRTEGNENPHWDGDISEGILKRLMSFGSSGAEEEAPRDAAPGSPSAGGPSANGNGNGNGHGPDVPPDTTKRHPEDHPDAVPDAGQEVGDPERIRVKAARLGLSARSLEPGYFEALVRRLYRAVHRVRAGAVVIPNQNEAGEQLKVSASTDAAMAGIRADGVADGNQADRREEKWVPRTEAELEEAKEEIKTTREQIEKCRSRVEELQEGEEEVEGTTRVRRSSEQRRGWEGKGGLFGRISISPGKTAGIFGTEVLATTLVLSSKVADVFDAPLPLAILIALSLSFAIIVSSFVAAMAAAAIRLPGRIVGLLLLAAYVAVLYKFVPGLDALRESNSEGVQAMTAATLAACFVAGFTGYITATREDRREEVEERELKRSAGTPLRHALQDLREAEDAHDRARRRAAHVEYELAQLWEEIERFRDSADRAEVTAMKRRCLGVEADAEVAKLEAIAATGVDQERAAAEWATVISLVAFEKARLEDVPDEEELRLRLLFEDARTGGSRKEMSTTQWVAAGVVGAGALASFAFGLAPLAFGVAGGVFLYLFDQRRDDEEVAPEDEEEPTGVVPPASEEDPRFNGQPDRTRAKYTDGGSKSAERQ